MNNKTIIMQFLQKHGASREIFEALEDLSECISTRRKVGEPMPEGASNNVRYWSSLPPSARRYLCLMGIDTLTKMLTLTEGQLLSLPSIGVNKLNKIKNIIYPFRLPDEKMVEIEKISTYPWLKYPSGNNS